METDKPSKQAAKLHLALDYRFLTLALLGVIVVMILLWKPWSVASDENQTVQVNGEATVSAVPDEFIFYPSYSFPQKNSESALKALTAKSNAIVEKLKDLGVAENDIKTSADNYKYYYSFDMPEGESYSLQLTVTINDEKLAQKVQDYLVSTRPKGSITPQSAFSDEKRKELESKARDEATKDARKKAEQMGENLGFRVGAVKAVSDNSGFGVMPYAGRDIAVSDSDAPEKSLNLNPGENELSYTVSVTYYID
jgi:uncharacterized protein YggE